MVGGGGAGGGGEGRVQGTTQPEPERRVGVSYKNQQKEIDKIIIYMSLQIPRMRRLITYNKLKPLSVTCIDISYRYAR